MNNIKIMANLLPKVNLLRKVAVKLSGNQLYNDLYYAWIRNVIMKNIDVNPVNYTESLEGKKQDSWKIWVMWWQGESAAPNIVKANIMRLRQIFGKENVVLITEFNYQRYVNLTPEIQNKFSHGVISLTHLSDIIRFNLLNSHGGLWVDAKVAVSENYKLPRNKGFLTLVPVGDGYASFIGHGMWTGWFIGGNKGGALFQYMVDFFNEYWEKNDVLFDYYLVDDAISVFAEVRSDFQAIQKDLAYDGDYYYLINKLTYETGTHEYVERWREDERYMIQKLTYKISVKPLMKERTLLYLLEQTDNVETS